MCYRECSTNTTSAEATEGERAGQDAAGEDTGLREQEAQRTAVGKESEITTTIYCEVRTVMTSLMFRPTADSKPAFMVRVANQSHHRASAPSSGSVASFPQSLAGSMQPIHVSIDLSNLPELSSQRQDSQGMECEYDVNRKTLPAPPSPQ